jgi:hypothetical protein
MLELVIHLTSIKNKFISHHNLLHLGHLMLMTTGKHLLHIQQLQPTEIMLNYFISWDEAGQRWIGKDDQNNEFAWSPDSSSWFATGN